ncbi:hypothetical protein ACFPMF_09165 [Larkinella bovis]|uniref:Uncharacterized protein n=1 Tax=Larkinella bovis TaxID=683041 RepID=A0ABW0IA78_9BACT
MPWRTVGLPRSLNAQMVNQVIASDSFEGLSHGLAHRDQGPDPTLNQN